MRKTIVIVSTLSVLTVSTKAQIISQFTWDANPVTTAAIGPNGTSVSAGATSTAGGVGGTNGLSANGGGNINLIVPGSSFELPGLDVSVDFQKEENGASFFALGGLDFGISTGAIYAKLPFSTGTITLNSIMAVPATGWHTYRFVYNNNNGIFTGYVDGVQQYTTSYAAGTPLYWTGATNVTIGGNMDGSGSTAAELDNLIVQVPPAVLPLTLISFDVRNTGTSNQLDWTMEQEAQLQDYTVERSADGTQFSAITTITPQQGDVTHTYTYTDHTPLPTSYYRLKMTDNDGATTWSAVKKITLVATGGVSVTCYPNPVVDYANLRFDQTLPANYRYSILTADGRLIQAGAFTISGTGQQVAINLSAAPKGMLFIRLNVDESTSSILEVLKK